MTSASPEDMFVRPSKVVVGFSTLCGLSMLTGITIGDVMGVWLCVVYPDKESPHNAFIGIVEPIDNRL